MIGEALGALAIIAGLTGCASQPVKVWTEGNAGPRPTNIESLVRAQVRKEMKDPGSAQVENIAGPKFLVVQGSTFTNGYSGWVICYEVNAKNGYGAYTGIKESVLVIREGVVLHSERAGEWSALRTEQVNNVCASVRKDTT